MSFVVACAHRASGPSVRGHVFARPMDDVWDAAKSMFAERGITLYTAGSFYRMETAWVDEDGKPVRTRARMVDPDAGVALADGGVFRAEQESGPASPPQQSARPPSGFRGMGGRGARGQRGAVFQASRHHWVVEGEAMDDSHSRLDIYRVTRTGKADTEPAIDEELERELVRRVEGATDAGTAL